MIIISCSGHKRSIQVEIILENDANLLSPFVEGRPGHLSHIAASRKGGHGAKRPPPMDHPDQKPRCTAGVPQRHIYHCFARRRAYISATSLYTPIAPQLLSGKRTVFVLLRCTRWDGVTVYSSNLCDLKLVPAKRRCLVPLICIHREPLGRTNA
jgi:hypothetical protein